MRPHAEGDLDKTRTHSRLLGTCPLMKIDFQSEVNKIPFCMYTIFDDSHDLEELAKRAAMMIPILALIA